MSKALVIEERLRALDVTKIAVYTNKIRDIGTLNKMMGAVYMQDFIVAHDITNTMLSQTLKCHLQVDTELKTAKAVAYLDKASDFLKSKDMKDTQKAREAYVDMDPDVIRMRELRAKTEAMVTFLKNKLRSFQDAQHAVKKIAYGDQQMTDEEGFRRE